MKTKKEVVQDFFDALWTREDSSIIKEVFVPDSEDQQTAAGLAKEDKLSPDDFLAFQQAILGLVTKMKVTIEGEGVESGDWLIIECSVSAESRSSGKQVQMTGCAWARITDGKIREAQNYFDFLHFFEGLGLLPEDTMSKCLSGTRIG